LAAAGTDQTCSLVSRSHQRCGRIKVPNAATAQIVANSRKLAMRKNPPFISYSENGPIMPPLTSLFYHFNQFANRIRNAMILRAIFFLKSEAQWGQGRIHICDVASQGTWEAWAWRTRRKKVCS